MQIAAAIALLAAAAQNYEGKIEKFDAKSGKITMLLSDKSTGNWTLSPKAKVFAPNHKPTGKAALHAGEHARVSVAEDGTVQDVWIEQAEWGTAHENDVRRWDGHVVAIKKRDPLTFEVMRDGGGAKMMFTANPATKFMRGSGGPSQAGSIDDVKDGANVRVLMNTKQHKVFEVLVLE